MSSDSVRKADADRRFRPLEPLSEEGRAALLDGVFAFALISCTLAASHIEDLAGGACALVIAAYAFIRRGAVVELLRPRAFLMIPALIALASTLWSEQPVETLRQSSGLVITIIGALLLSAGPHPAAVFRGMSLAATLYVCALAAVGLPTPADAAGAGLILAAATTVFALRDKAWVWANIGAFAALVCGALAVAAGGAALLGLAVSIGALAALMALLRASVAVRSALSTLLACVVLVIGVFYRDMAAALHAVSRLAQSGPALSSPAELWSAARKLIGDQPLLGQGFFVGRSGPDGVHNSFIDILIQVGWLGLWAVGACLIVGVICLAVRFAERPNLALCFWGGILVHQLIRTPIEDVGYAPFLLPTLLLTAALAAAFSPEPAPARPRRRSRIESPAQVHYLREHAEQRSRRR